MSDISQNTFWSTITIIASAIGGVLLLAGTHAGEPKHPQAAHVSRVSDLELKTGIIATIGEHNSRLLDELKVEVKELRTEQREASQEILRAIQER